MSAVTKGTPVGKLIAEFKNGQILTLNFDGGFSVLTPAKPEDLVVSKISLKPLTYTFAGIVVSLFGFVLPIFWFVGILLTILGFCYSLLNMIFFLKR